MKAVVLAGGLRSGSEIPGSGLPRALWPFPHQPLIHHVLDFLARSGCDQIAICANGKTKLIASQLASSPWKNLHYSEDPLPRGPAGCLRDLQDWLGSDTFLAIQGTGHYDFDLAAMVADHQKSSAAITVGARACPDDLDLLEPAGVYLVNPITLRLVQTQGYQDFKEQFLPRVLSNGYRVRCHALRGTATLIHSPGHYLSALREAILRATASPLPAGFRLLNDAVAIHETATLNPAARITGPAWIDAHATIDANAVLAGPVIVGPHSYVGANALLHRTVLMTGARIDPHAQSFSTILAPASHAPAKSPQPVRASSTGGRTLRDSGAHPLDRLLNLWSSNRRATAQQRLARP